MSKVLCFGELLLRLSPQLGGEWIKQHTMPVFIGGSELNVATALARWQVPVYYFTALPDHYLSKEIILFLQQEGIDTKKIHSSGNRVGTFYLPQGADLKSAGVIYDRAYSAYGELRPGQLDWDQVLEDISWFHFSAISPALNEGVAAVCLEAVKAAGDRGITVSVDLNHRAKLWKWGKEPGDVMPQLAAHCDVVMGNVWAANTMLGTSLNKQIHEDASTGKYLAQARQTSAEVMERFPHCHTVANTFRLDGDNESIRYFASVCNRDNQFNSNTYTCNSVADRAGSGDCYMAGLIYGSVNQLPPQAMVEYATAAAFGKLQEKGDVTHQSVSEVYQTLQDGAVQKGRFG